MKKCYFDNWRYARPASYCRVLEKVIVLMVFVAWVSYFFIEKSYVQVLHQDSQLVDVLLGLPLMLMLGLVSMIIVMGLLRVIFCLMGCMQADE